MGGGGGGGPPPTQLLPPPALRNLVLDISSFKVCRRHPLASGCPPAVMRAARLATWVTPQQVRLLHLVTCSTGGGGAAAGGDEAASCRLLIDIRLSGQCVRIAGGPPG